MKTHPNHSHKHGPGCGHLAVKHDDHVDHVHDGHLHNHSGTGVEEHAIGVTGLNPSTCTPQHACGGHTAEHVHGPNCGHAGIPHGDHVDYLVKTHLHHPHNGHCDDHGTVTLA